MAAYTMAHEISRRTVIRLPAPTVGAELEKALVAAVEIVKESGRTVYDDSILVEVGDEEIRLVFIEQDWT